MRYHSDCSHLYEKPKEPQEKEMHTENPSPPLHTVALLCAITVLLSAFLPLFTVDILQHDEVLETFEVTPLFL